MGEGDKPARSEGRELDAISFHDALDPSSVVRRWTETQNPWAMAWRWLGDGPADPAPGIVLGIAMCCPSGVVPWSLRPQLVVSWQRLYVWRQACCCPRLAGLIRADSLLQSAPRSSA